MHAVKSWLPFPPFCLWPRWRFGVYSRFVSVAAVVHLLYLLPRLLKFSVARLLLKVRLFFFPVSYCHVFSFVYLVWRTIAIMSNCFICRVFFCCFSSLSPYPFTRQTPRVTPRNQLTIVQDVKLPCVFGGVTQLPKNSIRATFGNHQAFSVIVEPC